jgi:hypothetical protein
MNMVAATFASSRQSAGRFYVWMAAACAIVAFGGFAPTYWLQVPAGTFVGAPLLHLHAALFSGWTLLLLSQTVLAARGQIGHHRAWGLMGISLATAMVLVGVATAILSLDLGLAANYGDRSRAFFIVPVTAIALFAGFFAAAIVNIERPDIHKRLMLLATISLLPAAVARLFFVLSTGGGPGMRPGLVPPVGVATAMGPGLLVELLIVAGIAYDWRTRGRPHPVWYVGAAAITAVTVLRTPLSATPIWLAIADAATRLVR